MGRNCYEKFSLYIGVPPVDTIKIVLRTRSMVCTYVQSTRRGWLPMDSVSLLTAAIPQSFEVFETYVFGFGGGKAIDRLRLSLRDR